MAWSRFCTRLIEAVDRHLGDRSKPSQIVKEAAAQGDARRLLAAAERDAERIRRGELDIEMPPELSRVPVRSAEPPQHSAHPDRFENSFPYGNKVLVCKNNDKDKKIQVRVHRVTRLGTEILSLGKFEPDYEYLMSIAREIKKQSFDVYLGDLVERLPDGTRSRNLREIT